MRHDAIDDTIAVMDHDRLPSPRGDDDRDHLVVLRGVTWRDYESLLHARSRAGRRQPKLAYLDGDLELMTKSMRHELAKKLIARLLECFAEERRIELIGAGETTFRRKAKQAGVEPDECYYVGKIRPSPELAIEVVLTSGGIEKLEVYRRLKVRELWFWIEGGFWAYRLVGDRYQEIERSVLVPDFDFHEIARIVLTAEVDEQTSAVRAYRNKLRKRGQ